MEGRRREKGDEGSEGEERGKAVCCRMSKDTKKREGDRMATIGPRDNIVLQ